MWTSYLDSGFQQHIEARQRTLKYKCAKASQRDSLWEREYPVQQNRPSWKWRLSSSWDKPGGRWINVDDLPKEKEKEKEKQQVDPWHTEFSSRPERLRRRMEEIKQRVDEDPFKAIFGSRQEGTSYKSIAFRWSPLNWGLAAKAEAESLKANGPLKGDQPRIKPAQKSPDESNAAKEVHGSSLNPKEGPQLAGSRSEASGVTAYKPMEPAAEDTSSEPNIAVSIPPNSDVDDFVIDPITLRKVPRKASPPGQYTKLDTSSTVEITSIPVQPFVGYRARSDNQESSGETNSINGPLQINPSKQIASSAKSIGGSNAERGSGPLARELEDYDRRKAKDSTSRTGVSSRRDWLDEEGFRSRSHRTETTLPVRDWTKKADPASRSESKRANIESSLDRYLQLNQREKTSVKSSDSKDLQYIDTESRLEDMDLLRASDVRASSGLAGRPPKETDEEKRKQRKRLEENFNRSQGLEMQYAEELATQTLGKNQSIPRRRDTEDESHTMPQGLETSELNEVSSLVPPTYKTDAFGYDLTPQGLETSYERELENPYAAVIQGQEAAARDAELDAFDRTPQGLETSFVREQEARAFGHNHTQEVAESNALLAAAEADGFSKEPQGLETSYARENERSKSATSYTEDVEAPKGEVKDAGFDNVNYAPQGHRASSAGATQQIPGEGDMSANVHEFAGRDRWYKKNAPHATDMHSLHDNVSAHAVQSSCKDSSEAVTRNLWANDPGLAFETQSIGGGVQRGLRAYDDNLGGKAYQFHTGQDSLEADILQRNRELAEESVKPGKDRPSGPYSGSEALAMRWEEEEQKLHEEVRETEDLLSEVHAEIQEIVARKKTPISMDTGGDETYSASQTSLSNPASHEPLATSSNPSETKVPKPAEVVNAEGSNPTVYKILAYDPSKEDVTTVTTTSSGIPLDEATMSPSEVIPRLTHPVKFLSHFAGLQASGYEIVSGSGDVLIFKKVRTTADATVIEPCVTYNSARYTRRPMNPIDGTTTQTGNFASPTGFVNYDAVFPPPLPDQESPFPGVTPNQSEGKVRREEDVFSGSSRRWQDDHRKQHKPKGRFAKAARRVFWVGVWTSGCCYAVGVVTEFFRTGGSNGLGAQGF